MSLGPAASTPAVGLAVASAVTAPAPASDIAAIAAQLVADAAENLSQPLAAPGQSALAAMVAGAATRQDSLAPLLADLAVAVNAPAMPADARATATQILAAQTPLDADIDAASLRGAAQNSGVFLEASLAAAALNPELAPPNLQMDLKALLLQLTSELAPFIQGPAQPRATPSSAPRTLPSRLSGDQAEPPVGGGPTAGQPASRPTLDATTDTPALARALQQEAQGALARVQLSQAASVEHAGEATRWMFEIPIATPGGAGIAQFEITRDGGGRGGIADTEPLWRARFSVDVAPSGPVHADVMLSGGRARVTLMAEDDAARQALAAHQDELIQALAAENPDVAVRVVAGAPERPRQPPGQLVDRRS